MTVFTGNYVYTVAVTIVTYYLYALTNCIIKVDSHIACRAHAVPLQCHAFNSHMPRRSPALLRQCRVLRESPCGSRKYLNC